MGGDGGSVSVRSEMVRKAKRKPKEDPSVDAYNRWTTCAVSNEPLRSPVVVCALGNLYNKTALIHYLISMKAAWRAGTEPPYEFAHIRAVKDVYDAKLHFDDPSKLEDPKNVVLFSCPITGVPGNGKWRFVFMIKCGCVVSEKAIQQVREKKCLSCGAPLSQFITIPTAEKKEELKAKEDKELKDKSKEDKEHKEHKDHKEEKVAETKAEGESRADDSKEEKESKEGEAKIENHGGGGAIEVGGGGEWMSLCPEEPEMKRLRKILATRRTEEEAAKRAAKKSKHAAKVKADHDAAALPMEPGAKVEGKVKRGPAMPSSSSSAAAGGEVHDADGARKRERDGKGDKKSKKRAKSTVTTTTTKVAVSTVQGSDVFKSLFLPPQAVREREKINFTSTKFASASPALF